MIQCSPVWNPADLSFDMVDDLTSDPVITIRMETPIRRLSLTAEPKMDGATLILRGLHVQGASANKIGAANLMVLARTVMERMDIDRLVVEGALRTTGANPGHRPSILRFSRRLCPAPAPRTGSR